MKVDVKMNWYVRKGVGMFLLALLLFVSGCNTSGQQEAQKPSEASKEIYVLAAASLADVMDELVSQYESAHPDQKLIVSFGSSGTLQHQIEQGAPADLFFSAASKQMTALVDKGLIDRKDTADLLANRLVLILPRNASFPVKSFRDLEQAGIKKIAVGQPESVPAGTYAKQTLTKSGIWEILQPKLVFAKDVRQVLSYVETGNVDAGIVYRTDAASSSKVTIAATADVKSHSPIVYPLGIVKGTNHPVEAKMLYNWLCSPDRADVYRKYGFELAGGAS